MTAAMFVPRAMSGTATSVKASMAHGILFIAAPSKAY